MNKSISVTESEKIILETLRLEFYPTLEKLKDILLRIQNSKIFLGIYSPTLSKLEQEYFELLVVTFSIDRKLTTPNILFKNIKEESQAMITYFRWRNSLKDSLTESSRYIEIIDRTIDRKRQTLQNTWTLILALIAIFLSVVLN